MSQPRQRFRMNISVVLEAPSAEEARDFVNYVAEQAPEMVNEFLDSGDSVGRDAADYMLHEITINSINPEPVPEPAPQS